MRAIKIHPGRRAWLMRILAPAAIAVPSAIGCDSSNQAGRKQIDTAAAAVDPVRVEAYWKRLGEILLASAAKIRQVERSAESSIVRAHQVTAIVGDGEAAVRSESQDGIDPELAAFAARFARQLQKLTRILERLGRLAMPFRVIVAGVRTWRSDFPVFLSIASTMVDAIRGRSCGCQNDFSAVHAISP